MFFCRNRVLAQIGAERCVYIYGVVYVVWCGVVWCGVVWSSPQTARIKSASL